MAFETEQIISLKKFFLTLGLSVLNCRLGLEKWEYYLKSQILAKPLEVEYIKRSARLGWNTADVMTSFSWSILGGLMSTTLKMSRGLSTFHRLTLRSSAEMKLSPSQESERELMWMW